MLERTIEGKEESAEKGRTASMRRFVPCLAFCLAASPARAFVVVFEGPAATRSFQKKRTTTTHAARRAAVLDDDHDEAEENRAAGISATPRRGFLAAAASAAASAAGTAGWPDPARAVGPVKVALEPTSYTARPCPPDKPIPGEKAMVGMRGLCVTVEADMKERTPKELEKVGVYGFVRDGETGDSVLANNPDLSTDAGQFAMIETVRPEDRRVTFEFIAAVPRDRDLSGFENGIGPLDFSSLRLISFPGDSSSAPSARAR